MKNKFSNLIKMLSVCLLLCAIFTVVAAADTTATAANTDGARNSDGVFDFEGATVGDITGNNAKNTLFYTTNNYNKASIVEDEEYGKLLQWEKIATGSGGNSLRLHMPTYSVQSGAVNTSSISLRVRFVKGNSNSVVRFMLASWDTGVTKNAIDFRKDGNNTQISIGNGWENISVGEDGWFDLKFVYYEGDQEPTSASDKTKWHNPKLSVFANDVLLGEIKSSSSWFSRCYAAEKTSVLMIASVSATIDTVLQIDDVKTEYSNVVTPEIMSANVSHESNLYLYYAVPKSSITTGETPKLVGTDKNGEFEVTSYTEETVRGVDCYVFKTRGVPAKEIGATETVRIVAGSSISEPKTYSVEQYLYDKLYDEGYVLETEDDNADIGVGDGKDYARKKMYYKLLEYGALAEEILCDEVNIATTPYVSINGTTADISGEYAVGTEFVLNAATVEGRTIASYTVVVSDAFGYNITSYSASIGDTVTISGFTLVYPVYAE